MLKAQSTHILNRQKKLPADELNEDDFFKGLSDDDSIPGQQLTPTSAHDPIEN